MQVRGLISAILLVVSICTASAARARLQLQAPPPQEQVPLYLPEVKYVRLVAFGFENFLSDILWFNTISYFGREFQAGKDFRWLNHMCDLTSSLDSRALHVYDFCPTLLAWIAKQPEEAQKLLSRGIENFPQNWELLYARAFNYLYFLDRRDDAQRDLETASHLPGAPPQVATLASRLMASSDDPQVAVDFLQSALSRANDANVRKALRAKLKRARLTRDLQRLDAAAASFEAHHGRFPSTVEELIAAGLVNALPKEPYGGSYVIDPEIRRVRSTSGRKPLELTTKRRVTEGP